MRRAAPAFLALLAACVSSPVVALPDDPPAGGKPAEGGKPADGGKPAGPPKPAEGAETPPAATPPADPPPVEVPAGWLTIRNDSETFEVKLPPGFKEVESRNVYRVKHLAYSGEPYLSTQVKIYAYEGQNNLDHFVAFCRKDVGGTAVEFVPGSTSRFIAQRDGSDGTYWRHFVEARIKGKFGYYIDLLTPLDVFEGRREDFDLVLDSFRAFSAPEDSYTVPAGWKEVKNEGYAVMGPVAELPDAGAKAQLENRLFRVSTWMDPSRKSFRLARDLFLDQRKFIARSVIRVYPDRDSFRKAAGSHDMNGRYAVFNPEDPDSAVIVDGSPDSTLDEHELTGAASVQYMASRLPPMWPWLREGFRAYWEAASRRDGFPGLFTPDLMKEAKEVFRKRPPKFEDLMAMDGEAFRALGQEGRLAAWGFVQYSLHGQDAEVRNAFRRFLRDSVGAASLDSTWSSTHPKFKAKDYDRAAAKYVKDYKLD